METANSLAAITLNVRNPLKLAEFYCDTLGMVRFERNGEVAVGYGGQGAALILRSSSNISDYQHAQNHRYWKIAITLPNLDLAHDQLTKKGIDAPNPRQFREIAYLTHITDPEGHIVELIQHTFDGKPRDDEGDPVAPLGGGAQLGLITFRTDNIEREMVHCLEELGMSYLSRQPVADLGFDLYFFAFTKEKQPNPDVNAVTNREWLWQRPYTVLEFQHRLDGEKILHVEAPHSGAASVIIQGTDKITPGVGKVILI